MNRFIRELRHRGVLRTVGLYIGVCWLIVQVASVLLPTFDSPEWVLRAIIVSAGAGLPVAAVLAWIYEISKSGIHREIADGDTAVPAIGSRKMDFVVIGVLFVALSFSVYLNLVPEPEPPAEIEPVSVLIANFENGTGEAIFDGVLEQALMIGLEAAPYVYLFERDMARSLLAELDTETDELTAEAARLIALREGVGVLVTGSIASASRGYQVTVSGIDPVTGEPDFDIAAEATDRDSVLGAVASLARLVRVELGEETLREVDPAIGSRTDGSGFSTTSIEAAKAYTDGLRLALQGDHEAAIERYKAATDIEPEWGEAIAAWALAATQLGQAEEARELWNRMLARLDTMSERSRLHNLGMYYAYISQDYEQAFENFSELVEKFPASTAGRNNLAVTAFLTLDFETAAEEGEYLVQLYPSSPLYRSNLALYAMYAGDFETAVSGAASLIEDEPEYAGAYLPLAIAALEERDFEEASRLYRDMATKENWNIPRWIATIGSADARAYSGEFDEAREILSASISDDDDQQPATLAIKHIVLAETYAAAGDRGMAVAEASTALDLSDRASIKIAAALVFLSSGDLERAGALADDLKIALASQSRAYGMMIQAAVARQAGRYAESIDSLRASLELADLWRIRLELGLTYLNAGSFAAAFDELQRCYERRGEATAMFLDDVPTFRYLAELPYWTARAQTELGMLDAAAENYRSFLALRPQGGVYVEDARTRLQ